MHISLYLLFYINLAAKKYYLHVDCNSKFNNNESFHVVGEKISVSYIPVLVFQNILIKNVMYYVKNNYRSNVVQKRNALYHCNVS